MWPCAAPKREKAAAKAVVEKTVMMYLSVG